jgi:hypothetical protein
MQCGAVGLTKNGGGRDAHLAARAYDSDGDFPAIGDEDFAKHFPWFVVSGQILTQASSKQFGPDEAIFQTKELTRRRHFEVPANLAREKIIDFTMARNGRCRATRRILKHRVAGAFTKDLAALFPQVLFQIAALHRTPLTSLK